MGGRIIKYMRISRLAIIVLTIAMAPKIGPAFAETEPMNEAEKIEPNSHVEFTAGVLSSDIGGGKKRGLAVSLNSVRKYSNSRFLLRLGLEYNRKNGTGEAGHMNMANGEILYQGQADVSLHYLQTCVAVGYYVGSGKFNITPYFGVGPALLVSQRINPAGPTMTGAFEDYRGYSSFDFLVLGGFTISYSRLVLDLQLAKGLIDLDNRGDGLDGSSIGGSALIDGNSRSQSIRFGLGVNF